MDLRRSSLIDIRYVEGQDGIERRQWVPRQEIERQLTAMLKENGLEVPSAAWQGIPDGRLFHVWRECLSGCGYRTPQFGPLPVELMAIIERAGYDPMSAFVLPPEVLRELLRRWKPIPRPAGAVVEDVREPVIP